jgi:hypothetical protein
MADVRTIGTAVEAYAVDMAFYPTYAEGPVANATFQGFLEPTYVKTVPREDGWRTTFYAASASRFYTLASAARDKVLSGALASYSAGITSDMDCDIVYSNGSFVQYPEGVQDDG